MGWTLVVLVIISCALTMLQSYIFINIQLGFPPLNILSEELGILKEKNVLSTLDIFNFFDKIRIRTLI